tara:strand:+ start:1131 stop:2405 length:1275 start_codon:yes stop_codon:yes gene_type:complete
LNTTYGVQFTLAVSFKVGQYYKELEANQDNKLTGGQQAGHILAHTLLGAAVSYATGNDAVTGGISAGAGEATAPVLSKFLYGSSDPTKLTAEQKDTISAITSVLGVGIGATTGSANDAANAAETSKVAVEDNYYYADLKNIHKASKKQVERIYNIQKSSFEGKCRSAGGDCNDVIQKMINFVENPYVKSKYGDLRNQTIAKLESNPELLITYFDSLAYKFNAKDRSILNRYIKPTLEAGGCAIGGVGSIGGAVYACGASAGIGCYAAVVAGSAGLSSSSDHLITGTKNFGKPLSQQDLTQIVQTLQGLGLSKEAAQTLQLGIDILGTGGVGFGVGTVAKSGKYVPTAQVIPNNFNLYAGRTLIYHDNIGGHAVAKHVGKSDQQLIARLSADGGDEQGLASSGRGWHISRGFVCAPEHVDVFYHR